MILNLCMDRNVHIGCVPEVIKEGRATMVSAFASFKFGVSFCFTQLISVLMVFYVSLLEPGGGNNNCHTFRLELSRVTISTWWLTLAWLPSPSSSSGTPRHTTSSPRGSPPGICFLLSQCSPLFPFFSSKLSPTSSFGSTFVLNLGKAD